MRCRASYGICVLIAAVPAFAATLPVTFYRDIAPIVYQNCSPCHRPGESAPFPLLSYDDARRHARQIADVTNRRYMPPWPPEDDRGTFVEERRLTDAQIRLITEWVPQGTPAQSDADTPAPPSTDSEWNLGKPDLLLHVQQPFQLRADGPDIFWNFVIPVPVTATRWVQAVEIRPAAPKVVHHASLLVDHSGSARRHERISGAGFPGMDLTMYD